MGRGWVRGWERVWIFYDLQVCHPERRLPESKDLAAAVFAAVICPRPPCVVDQTNHSARSALNEILQLRFRMTGESLTALTLTGWKPILDRLSSLSSGPRT
jgi:hypothetical protein